MKFGRYIPFFALFLWSFASQLAYAQGSSTLLEISCESFPRDVSEADLKERFGEDNVVSEPLVGADDGPQDGTVIFPDDETMRLEMFWWDPEVKTKLSGVRVRSAGSLWQSADGFRIGTTLKEIESKNGWPFRMRGFVGEGYPGRVLSWGRGRLTTHDSGSCTQLIFLLPQSDGGLDLALRRQVGRGEFSSGHPVLQAWNPVVYQHILAYDWR